MTIIFMRIKQTRTNHDINFTFWSAAPVPAKGGEGNNQWTLIRRCNLSWYSSGDSKHLGACRQSTIYPGSQRMSYGEDWLHRNRQLSYTHIHTRQKSIQHTQSCGEDCLHRNRQSSYTHTHTHDKSQYNASGVGIEPMTAWIRIMCSTNWANFASSNLSYRFNFNICKYNC